MFVEGGMVVATIFSNVIFLAIRTFERVKIDITPDMLWFDHHSDFMSTWSTMLITSLTLLFSGPLINSIFIRLSSYTMFMSDGLI